MAEHKIIHGDCLQTLKTLPDNSVDSIVTDPPAGIGFMGKEWDKDKGGRDNWIAWMQEIAVECLRVLKHGGHAFVWSLPRTSHWTAMAWENAGFEPRDRVAHVFGSGFPKSHDISKAINREAGAVREVVKIRTNGNKGGGAKTYDDDNYIWDKPFADTAPATDAAKEWDGWGTALKPAVEDWWLFRKPIAEKTVAQNVLKYGTGALNIDACRVPTQDNLNGGTYSNSQRVETFFTGLKASCGKDFVQPVGRFPANIILDDSEEVRECFPETGAGAVPKGKFTISSPNGIYGKYGERENEECITYDASNASRFFKRIAYFAKASRSERNKGCEDLEARRKKVAVIQTQGVANAGENEGGKQLSSAMQNHHPTVKPVALMQYLIQMITPKGGTVLDAFAGSGTTGVAAKSLGFGFIGLEREGEYVAIARARIAATIESCAQSEPKTAPKTTTISCQNKCKNPACKAACSTPKQAPNEQKK